MIPALVALSLSACNSDTTFSSNDNQGKPVAVVNGVNIIDEDVTANMANIPANLIAGKEQEIRKNITDQLIERELILQDADNANLMNDEEFKKLYQNLVRNLALEYMVNKKRVDGVTDEMIQAEYDKNKENYIYPTVKARHILVKTEDEAKAIIKKLEKGADFVELAKKESTGPSGKNGGDLGWFNMKQMVPEFATAAFTTEKGKFTTEPVKTQFGYHVILVEDRKDDNVATLEMVSEPLRQQLQNNALRTYIDGLKQAAKIKHLDVVEVEAEEKAEAPAEAAPTAEKTAEVK